AQRDEQQRLLEEAISDGVTDGTFTSPYPTDAARAIASLCVALASWYQPDGPLAQDEVVERHLDFASRIVGGWACPGGAGAKGVPPTVGMTPIDTSDHIQNNG